MIRLFRLLLGVMLLGMVALVSAVITMHFAIHGGEVTVPDLRGTAMQTAMRQTAGMGLNIAIDNKYYSAEVPAGRVLTQFPMPGTVVRREWRVRVTESLGPQRVQIPNVVGQPERLASIEIRRAGLELGSIARMPDISVPEGTVIAQNPAHGAAGVERPSVSLLVSAPAPIPVAAFVMPQLVGQPATAAESAIVHAGLRIASVEDKQVAASAAAASGAAATPTSGVATAPAQPTQPASAPTQVAPAQVTGTVLAQSPPAGRRVDAATPITLTVAR